MQDSFALPGTPSQQAQDLLATLATPTKDPTTSLTVVWSPKAGRADDDAARDTIKPMLEELRESGMRLVRARDLLRQRSRSEVFVAGVKVAVQTRPGFAKGLTDGMPKLIATEGAGALFKSLVPLWGRQIPYTMMKFGAFENTVVALYKYAVPKPREECSKGEQLGVSFAAGYIAGNSHISC